MQATTTNGKGLSSDSSKTKSDEESTTLSPGVITSPIDVESLVEFESRPRSRLGLLKPFLIYILLLVYCIFGACAFYTIEKSLFLRWTLDPRVHNNTERCVGAHSFWASIFYVLTVCSTIGFGNLYPCTVPTKALTVVYSIIGIPLVILILTDLGKRNCHLMVILYHKIMSKWQKRQRQYKDPFPGFEYIDAAEPAPDANINGPVSLTAYRSSSFRKRAGKKAKPAGNFSARTRSAIAMPDSTEPPDLPVSFGLLLIFICLLVTSLYIKATEPGLPFDICIYYSFLFFLAGDYMTERYQLAIPTYILLFFGFATVSTTISIVLYNLDNLLNRIKRNIDEEIQQRVDEAIETDFVPTRKDAYAQPAAEDLVSKALAKQSSPWILSTLTRYYMNNLVDFTETEIDRANDELELYHEQVELEEQQRLLREQVDKHTKTETAAQTYQLRVDRRVGDPIHYREKSVQFPYPPIEYVEKDVGPDKPIRYRSTGSWIRPATRDTAHQAAPKLKSHAENTERQVKVDNSQQVMPKKRTVKTQFPRVDDEEQGARSRPGIGWLMEKKPESGGSESTSSTPLVARRGLYYKTEYF